MKSVLTLSLAIPLALALRDGAALHKGALLHNRAANSSSSSNTTCAPLHMIVARASLEAPGQGIIGAVVDQVQSAIRGSDSEAVVYPATLDNYVSSESAGVAGMQTLINHYEARCPHSKIALLGYSQGAQVVGDVLCGTSEANWTSTPPESPAQSKNIIASVQMGDPTFVLQQPQDVGNATHGGLFTRTKPAACPSSIMKSYCNFNDMYCDNGTSLLVHVSYVHVYGNVAAQWIIGRFGVNGTNTTTGSASPTSGGTSSSQTLSSNAARLGGSYLTAVLGLVMFLGLM